MKKSLARTPRPFFIPNRYLPKGVRLFPLLHSHSGRVQLTRPEHPPEPQDQAPQPQWWLIIFTGGGFERFKIRADNFFNKISSQFHLEDLEPIFLMPKFYNFLFFLRIFRQKYFEAFETPVTHSHDHSGKQFHYIFFWYAEFLLIRSTPHAKCITNW